MISELDEINIKNISSESSNRVKILTLKEKKEWHDCLSRLPVSMQDVYYAPEYYEIYEKNSDGYARCFIYEDQNGLALYPFLLCCVNDLGYEIDNDYYDIRGAYGYNGVLYSSNSSDLQQNFYKNYLNFCQANKIIAEFTRFNPVIKNHIFSKDILNIDYNRSTVYIDLTQGYETIYKGYSHSARGNLKKAIKNKLTVATYKNKFPYKRQFISMYAETMDRVKARRYLYFNKSYFDNTFRLLPVIHFVVFDESIPIASAICLTSKKILHVHFEVSKTGYLFLRPNDFLFDEIVKYDINKGFTILHLGGGRTSDEDDLLLRFKRNFSSTTEEFYVGTQIYDKEIYWQVCEQWRNKYPHLVREYENKFLKYRYTDSVVN